MIKISIYTINDYRARIPSLYPLFLSEQCEKVVDHIHQSGSVVREYLVISNDTIEISDSISNTAIYFACIELLGHVPVGEIRIEDGKKIFTLGDETS